MTSLLLRGDYTAEAWQRILREPSTVREQISQAAEPFGATLFDHWFAMDDGQFYAVVDGLDPLEGALLRHKLWSSSGFISLQAEPLFTPTEIVGTIKPTNNY